MTNAAGNVPSRLVRIATPILLLVAVGSLLAAIFLPVPGSKPTEPTPDPFVVPPFALTERSGRPVSNADLADKVWVAAFVFTRCTGPCPSVSATMARLQSDLNLADQPNLRLVTFTVDPDRDTPEQLKKYAEHFRAHPDRWLFLTGSEDELHRLAKNGFKIAAERSANPKPDPGQEFDHSTKLAVVDKLGRIRGFFDGYAGKHDEKREHYESDLAAMKQLVTELLAE